MQTVPAVTLTLSSVLYTYTETACFIAAECRRIHPRLLPEFIFGYILRISTTITTTNKQQKKKSNKEYSAYNVIYRI